MPRTAGSGTERRSAQPSAQGRSRRSTVGQTSVGQLYRGRVRLALLRDLALGEWTYAEIAHQLKVPVKDISQFAEEHKVEIAEVRGALAGELAEETAGLWIAKKQNRIAELQAEYEDVDEALDTYGRNRWSTHHKDMHRAKLSILRAVAEELGALPARSDAPQRQGDTVHYIIESEDVEALR